MQIDYWIFIVIMIQIMLQVENAITDCIFISIKLTMLP